ncbi:MAG TPA: hypothetical protein VJA66_12640 [Thermoanaerobaculia bacterium]
MRARAWWVLLVSAPALLAASSFDKTIPIPRTGETKLSWTSEGCSVRAVSLQNYPDREDIEKARKSDPNDHSWVWWNFHVENRGQTKCKIKLWVDVYGKDGQIAKSSDRSDTVDAGKLDDNIRLSTRMKTIDIADSPKARVRAEIGPK